MVHFKRGISIYLEQGVGPAIPGAVNLDYLEPRRVITVVNERQVLKIAVELLAILAMISIKINQCVVCREKGIYKSIVIELEDRQRPCSHGKDKPKKHTGLMKKIISYTLT
jgi:hypothetical protein